MKKLQSSKLARIRRVEIQRVLTSTPRQALRPAADLAGWSVSSIKRFLLQSN